MKKRRSKSLVLSRLDGHPLKARWTSPGIVDDAISAMNEAEDSNQYEDMQRKMSTQLGTTITK
jgi:hypothetical protein